MNERIEKLADQCQLYDGWFTQQGKIEKFAQLIVLEVLSVQEQLIAKGHNAWHMNKPTKEHFGVEE